MSKTVIGLLVVIGFSGVVMADDTTASEGIGLDLTLDFNSKYIWRGQNLSDDWVMQPGASFGFGDFTLGVWGNVDITNDNDYEWEFTEVDYYIDYSASLAEGIGFSLGYIYYDFPAPGGSTNEVYGGLSFDTVLDPSVTWYYDFDYANGSYIALGLGHTVALSDTSPLSLDLGLNLGWADSNYNDAYWGVDSSGFNDLTLSAGIPIEIGSWTVTPMVNYAMLIDSDVRDAASESDNFYGGIGLSTSF